VLKRASGGKGYKKFSFFCPFGSKKQERNGKNWDKMGKTFLEIGSDCAVRRVF